MECATGRLELVMSCALDKAHGAYAYPAWPVARQLQACTSVCLDTGSTLRGRKRDDTTHGAVVRARALSVVTLAAVHCFVREDAAGSGHSRHVTLDRTECCQNR
jgi:hypothetical protein